MPGFGPIKRAELIRFLRRLDFQGPYSGGKHQFMAKGNVRIPNPHSSDIGQNLLRAIFKEAGISEKDWKNAWPGFSPSNCAATNSTNL
jgi:predicted RNA binding protein YcfA (HicA-like mRNA interferase family)